MRTLNRSFVLLACLASIGLGSPLPAGADPTVGEAAPDFILHGTDGALYRLSEHVGKRGVVIAWFPKAFTPG